MSTEHKSRKGIITILVFAGLFIGLLVGAFLAARFFVDKGDGLVGGVKVLFYAVLFALSLAIAGGLAGKFLPRRKAVFLAWVAAPIGIVICLAVIWGVAVQRSETRDAMEVAYASLPPFEIRVTGPKGSEIENFSYVSTENLVRAQTRGETCTGPLKGRTRVALLTALRNIEARNIRCSDCDSTSVSVAWLIREAMGNVSSNEFQVSPKVLIDHREVEALLDSVMHAAELAGCD